MIDDRYFPLVVSLWIGPQTVGILRPAYEELDRGFERARREGTRCIQLADAMQVGRVDAAARSYTAEAVGLQVDRYADVNLRPSYVAMKNTIIRGTIRALDWLARKQIGVQPHASFVEASEAALARMEREGLGQPKGFDPATYHPERLGETA